MRVILALIATSSVLLASFYLHLGAKMARKHPWPAWLIAGVPLFTTTVLAWAMVFRLWAWA